MKKSSTVPVKSPTARKGSTKPRVYTPISRNPAAEDSAEEAISRTLLRVGPTQGVQAKLKVKPITRATAMEAIIWVVVSNVSPWLLAKDSHTEFLK